MRILGIVGSLRAESSNLSLLSAVPQFAPEHALTLYADVGKLPHFNPDLDGDEPPNTVRELRLQIAAADAVLVCSPEYAHGIPGSLKNALDWLVSSPVMIGKPTAAWTAGPGASEYAHPQLLEVLRTMSARVVPEACLVVARARLAIAAGRIVDESLAQALRACLAALAPASRTAE